VERNTTYQPESALRFWVLAIIAIGLAAGLAFEYLKEFITVAILQQTGGYPFGGEGPAPWHYKTATRYAVVTLSFGLPFFILLSFSLIALFKRNTSLLLGALFFIILLMSIALVVQNIGLEY